MFPQKLLTSKKKKKTEEKSGVNQPKMTDLGLN